MADILDHIVANRRREIAAKKRLIPQELLRELPSARPATPSMRQSILSLPGGVIAEFKRRSPSKGDISPMADAVTTVTAYQDCGAAASSVLTDTRYFGGSIDDLMCVALATTLPLLRKDFIIDTYQIDEARVAGASAILLIAAALTAGEISLMTDYAHRAGLEVLLELHGDDEISKLYPEADMIGINNRNLGTFHTDTAHSLRLIDRLPHMSVKIAESGIATPDDLCRLRAAGFDGFLIGEAFMKTPDPGTTLKHFIDAIR